MERPSTAQDAIKSLLSVSITDQWTEFPAFIKPKDMSPATSRNKYFFDEDGQNTEDGRYRCICSEPTYHKKCRDLSLDKVFRAKAQNPREFWESVKKGFDNRPLTEPADEPAVSPGASPWRPYPTAEDLAIDEDVRGRAIYGGKPPKCQVCPERHHYRHCPFYVTFGRRTQHRLETAKAYYRYATFGVGRDPRLTNPGPDSDSEDTDFY